MLGIRQFALAALLVCHAVAQAANAAPAESDWSLRMPVQQKVDFRGQVSFDKAGQGAGGMVYPTNGLGLAGLLVGIATHATIVNSTRSGEKSHMEKEADKVLQPFLETLDGFRLDELAGLALPAEANMQLLPDNAHPTGMVIVSAPVFYMTQDRSALILDNTVSVFNAASGDKPLYQNTVRVVSRTSEAADLVAHWQVEAGKALRDESAALFRLSLDIVRQHALAPREDAAARTFRYQEGKKEAMERAQLVDQRCDRALVKNLRGWLMSIPLKRQATSEPQCEAQQQGAQAPQAAGSSVL